MRPVWLSLLLLAAVVLARDTSKESELPQIEGKAIVAHIKYLADDKLQGRAAGSDGAKAATEYAAKHLERLGFKPMGDDGTYFQNFTLPRGFKVDPSTFVKANRGSKKTHLKYDKDLKPLSLSGPGDVTAPVVFAGYGIAAPELGYDDYAGIDVKGKVVIVLRHGPKYTDKKSPFSLPGNRRKYCVFQAKVSSAAGAGVAALIIVNDPANVRKAKDDVALQNVGGNPGKMLVIHMTYKAAKKLARVCGFSVQKEQRAIDKSMKPRSRLLEEATVHVNAALKANLLSVRNVCALLEAPRATTTPREGSEPAKPDGPRETLVIGAHIDHVGLGAYGSLAGKKAKGSIHNGADDNASGSSSLLEIAVFMKARRSQLKRDILFLLFTAEELGLLGSKHYVGAPKIPLDQCVAMVNLDMVGRLRRGRLQVGGVGTSPDFEDLIKKKNKKHRIAKIKFNPGGRAPSDNTSFYEKGMPVLFFFTGLHKDYHRPSDDWKGIDRKGIQKVARLAADVSLDLATRPTRPPFTRSDASGLDAGPFLGLSLEQKQDGIYVIHVEKKSPASRAKIKVGDKVEEFQDQPVKTISAFNQIHSNTKPKQKVKLLIRRGPRLLKKTARLGSN